ncbi:MAG: phosphonoacetaldehyde reductase [Verrucomicrobia bacterium]|jgi:alcohol dehydrogenase|nr:phosphonoacetaldehyde reductase [Verrucomicrobiota bacterium]
MSLAKSYQNEVRVANGDVLRVGSILDQMAAKSVFLVTHELAYQQSGAEAKLKKALAGRHVFRFTDFEPNPKLEDAERAVAFLKEQKYDAVLAVGGGSAIDMAKLSCAFHSQPDSPREVIADPSNLVAKSLPLIAVPTTAGTGSEATHFAVVYLDGQKFSLPHPSLLPDVAIIDPELTYNIPKYLTAVTGLDALCQGIESYWSIQSTDESRDDARKAIKLAWKHLESVVHHGNPIDRFAMCEASHFSGRAINISKTTAPHAISYCITSRCGIPHGHAVALTLGQILEHNAEVSQSDVTDPRGVSHVQACMNEILNLLECNTASEASQRFSALMESISCKTKLEIDEKDGPELLEDITENVNPERLGNNPRVLDQLGLHRILSGIL